jgi:hypothetical protein
VAVEMGKKGYIAKTDLVYRIFAPKVHKGLAKQAQARCLAQSALK